MTAPGLRQFLLEHAPFAQMAASDLEALLAHLEVAYYGPGEVLLAGAQAVAPYCFIVKQGRVQGRQGADVVLELGEGECFPLGALLAQRAARLDYVAAGDVFCLLLPREHFEALTRRSEVFLSYCRNSLGQLLDWSHQHIQAAYAVQARTEQHMNTPLTQLMRAPALTCSPDTPLRSALERIEAAGVGSIVVAEAGHVQGILTRTDLIGRVLLPQTSLDVSIAAVMSPEVACLRSTDTAAQAIALMAERGVRHLPVLDAADGTLCGVVSERDLFALQRLSVHGLNAALRQAADVPALARIAPELRRLSHQLVAQGVGAGPLTRIVSHLNDQLTTRVLELACARFALSAEHWCWLALGSEGRSEQTIVTDQDNALVFDAAHMTQSQALQLAQWVNTALSQVGFPLCPGEVMARNPRWCLATTQWQAQFEGWIERGDPQALLEANIFFDFRGLFGCVPLAQALRQQVSAKVRSNPRFLKQMADNALRNRAQEPGWMDKVLGRHLGTSSVMDLKLHGTVLFVDAARIWALAAGVDETHTVQRLQRLADQGRLPPPEVRAWVDAFEYLQLMRLRQQHRQQQDGVTTTNPNAVDLAQLSALEQRVVSAALRQARKVQQRLALDYP